MNNLQSMPYLLGLSTLLLFNGCGASNNGDSNDNTQSENVSNIDLSNYSQDALSTEQKYSLAHMWNEERLAYDIYQNLNKIYPIQQLENISTKSETVHIQLVENLVEWYDINVTNLGDYTIHYSKSELEAMGSGVYGVPAIQDLYDALYEEGSTSQIDALKVGCKVEVVDVDDLDKYIVDAQTNQALIDTFTILRNGSYKHYWSFDNGLKNLGITNGCASLGSDYDKMGIYPQ